MPNGPQGNNQTHPGKKVIIVGAGPGGLAAGMLLASRGYSVDIHEKMNGIGGRNSSLKLGDYLFDVGPTFFMMKDVLENIFLKCGKKLDDFVNVIPLDPMYRLKFGNGKELYPSTEKDKMRHTMENFSRGSYDGYLHYLAKEKNKYDKLIPCLSIPYGSLSDFFKKNFIAAIPYLDVHTSLYGVLSRYFADPDTRLAFTFQAKYIGMSPWTAPGAFSIISYIEHGGGIYHIQGGLNRLSVGMSDAFRQLGGKIHVRSAVSKILIENGEAQGVELEDGRIERSDYTIINADFAHAMTTIVEAKKQEAMDRQHSREKGLFMLNVHALPRSKKAFQRYPASQHHIRE